MTTREKLKRCKGCRQDFYNGKNSLGVKQCWRLADAKLVRKKEIHVDQHPPWNQKAEWFFDCYRREGHIYVDPKCTC